MIGAMLIASTLSAHTKNQYQTSSYPRPKLLSSPLHMGASIIRAVEQG